MKKISLVLLLFTLVFLINSCSEVDNKVIKDIELNLDFVKKEYVIGDEISFYGLQIIVKYEEDDNYYYLDDYSNVSFEVIDDNNEVVNGIFTKSGKYLVVVSILDYVSSGYEVIVYNTVSYSLFDAITQAYEENRHQFGGVSTNKYWEPIDDEGIFYGFGCNSSRKGISGPLRLQLQLSVIDKNKIIGLGVKVTGRCTLSIQFISESPYGKPATLSLIEFIEVDGVVMPVLVEEVGKSVSTAEYTTLLYEYKGTEEKMLYFCSPLVHSAILDVVVTFYIK